MPLRTPLVLATLLLAGCATKPPLVEAHASGPLTGSSFRFSSLSTDAAAGPVLVERMVADELQKRGLHAAGAGQAADYLVQVSYADRAIEVGAFVPTAGKDPRWLETGRRRRPWTGRGSNRLGLRIVETASGREAYEARVDHDYRKAAATGDLPTLVAAAVQPLRVGSP